MEPRDAFLLLAACRRVANIRQAGLYLEQLKLPPEKPIQDISALRGFSRYTEGYGWALVIVDKIMETLKRAMSAIRDGFGSASPLLVAWLAALSVMPLSQWAAGHDGLVAVVFLGVLF